MPAVIVDSTMRSGGRFRALTTLEALTSSTGSSSLEVTLSSASPPANTHSCGRLMGDYVCITACRSAGVL